jgi:S-adenosylmethionine:tRNA ribosyltransferase-isomerase
LKTDLFDYPLPDRLIAQQPADRRDASRLLVVDRQARTVAHRHFRDLPEYLRAGDRLFRNNAAVIPARLHATRPTGGHVECLLLRPATNLQPSALSSQLPNPNPQVSGFRSQVSDEWWCLLRPGKKLPVGAQFGAAGLFTGTVREKTGEGLVRVAFATAGGDILAVAQRIGEMPLPPYIAGRHTDAERALDRERYQTVYADRGHQVAAAAPTAGLHFTPELLAQLAGLGVDCADLTLHVGLGTFRPIMTEQVEDHAIHREVYEIPAATQAALFQTSGRRIAVGTTAVRTIEDFLSRRPDEKRWSGLTPSRSERVEANTLHQPYIGEAGIFIHPPRTFRGVDALITNFHQPRSTLLCLVAAFLAPGSTDGIAWLREIYAEAASREYRFFSYGDAMLIL